MVSIKAELVDKADLDDNENCINDMNEGISVKEYATTEVRRWFINPFYKFSQLSSRSVFINYIL